MSKDYEGDQWFDMGTHDSLLRAATYVRDSQKAEDQLIGSPDETAWRLGYIDDSQLRALAERAVNNGYGQYLSGLLSG